MRNVFWIAVVVIVVGLGAWFFVSKHESPQSTTSTLSETQTTPPLTKTTMQISSPAFLDSQSIPEQYSCEGAGISIPLNFSGVPTDAKSLALIMQDPDVPKNLLPSGLFVHWVVFNIPTSTVAIPENTTPPGIQGNNGAGKPMFTPPCPPDKEHRYFFTLYALDTMLDLKQGASKDEVEQAMQGHILEQAQLIGLYNKKPNR